MTYEAKFELEEATCELKHVNNRIEKHGEDDVLALDLDFAFETNNDVLALFAPHLKSSLYMKDDSGQSELVPDANHLTKLRLPALNGGKAFTWDAGQLVGPELRFHHGTTERSHVVFDRDVKVGKFKLDCREGGTVVVMFQAQVYPDDKQTAFLSKSLVNKTCTLSVTPAKSAAES